MEASGFIFVVTLEEERGGDVQAQAKFHLDTVNIAE